MPEFGAEIHVIIDGTTVKFDFAGFPGITCLAKAAELKAALLTLGVTLDDEVITPKQELVEAFSEQVQFFTIEDIQTGEVG